MEFFRRTFIKLAGAAALAVASPAAFAADMPAPLDKPQDVKIALVRYLSTGDFFQAYLSGVEAQAKALGVDLRVFDSRQDAALQADMVDQAIALGVDGIVIQHGLTESMKEAAQRAVDAGIKVVAFDVNVENDAIPQIEQSDYLLGKMALEQAVKDNGDAWKAGYVYVPGIAPARPPRQGLAGHARRISGHRGSRRFRHARQPDRQLQRQPGAFGAAGQIPTSR